MSTLDGIVNGHIWWSAEESQKAKAELAQLRADLATEKTELVEACNLIEELADSLDGWDKYYDKLIASARAFRSAHPAPKPQQLTPGETVEREA